MSVLTPGSTLTDTLFPYTTLFRSKGSKRLSKFNELIAGIRSRVPELFIQVGGSISFAPEGDGEQAKWLSDNARHALAELAPKPEQVTVTINTSQMNIVEQMVPADLAGTS